VGGIFFFFLGLAQPSRPGSRPHVTELIVLAIDFPRTRRYLFWQGPAGTIWFIAVVLLILGAPCALPPAREL